MRVPVAQREVWDEVKKFVYSLHGHRGEEVVKAEFSIICDQARLAAGITTTETFKELFTKYYARRLLLSCLAANVMKLSGSDIIQNYHALIGQIINDFFAADHWTRRKTVVAGSYSLATILAVLTVLSYFHAEGDNTRVLALEEVAARFGDEVATHETVMEGWTEDATARLGKGEKKNSATSRHTETTEGC
ncbi:hypothetical protein GGR56DRAFT_678875 [Xylariaceae sp. FL0804]|nr:hypothetical protein GGR56DRAFT_678875 [Xylariaceae sp. FL0804]